MNRILNGDGTPIRIVPSGPTCGGCVHFRRLQLNPGATRDLTQPTPGNCVEHLHAISLAVMTPNGPAGQFIGAGYPPVHEDFMACSRFAAVLVDAPG